MADVKKTNPKPKEQKENLYDSPRVGTVKDAKTGKYKYPK